MNAEVARLFEEAAQLLEQQEASPHRIGAYRQAASFLRQLEVPVTSILDEAGTPGLEELPHIGKGLAAAIQDIVLSGTFRTLEHLRGADDPEALLATIPGIGPTLAQRIHDELGIETLEELEHRAHSGDLGRIEGLGPKRLRAIKETLATRLQRRRVRHTSSAEPTVLELLDVDAEYRMRTAAGQLRKIAPKRFNPESKAWLPILHTERDGRHYTVLFSNTARAHDLNKIHDWVVIYLDNREGGQWTVVTETSGPNAGRRVVRGRERDSSRYYESGGRAY